MALRASLTARAVALAASERAASGTFGVEVYKGDTAFWQSVAVHDLAR